MAYSDQGRQTGIMMVDKAEGKRLLAPRSGSGLSFREGRLST